MLNKIYHALLIIEPTIACGIFIALFFISAPYGRHNKKGWGLVIREKPAWVLMEFPAFAMMPLFFLTGNHTTNPMALIFLLIWELHYLQRTFIYPTLMPASQRNFPLVVTLMGFTFNLINGYLNGYHLFISPRVYNLTWLRDLRFIGGALIFLAGYSLNLHADKILRELRDKSHQGYTIPRNGPFKWVSSPNYLGEIIEWSGWALLTWSLPGLLFALFTIANLLPRALSNHRWYKATFPDYPPERKAIIPYIL